MSRRQRDRQPFPVVSVMSALVMAVGFGYYAVTHQPASQAEPAMATPLVAEGSFYLEPPDTEVSAGSVVTATLYENSSTTPVNVAQVALTYPADKLELLSLAEGTVFTNIATTDTATPGLVRIARALPIAMADGISGRHKVVTVNFKVLPGASGEAAVGFDRNSTLLVSAADNKNILTATGGTIFRVRPH